MRILTNKQRECFALNPICDHWECIEAKQSRYDHFKTYLYLDGDVIVKCIVIGDAQYYEFELSEKVTPDRKYLLPKTPKGKPVILSSSTIEKRNGTGMRLNYYEKNIHLYNEITECSYYFNECLPDKVCDMDGFFQWVDHWCRETTNADKTDILSFAQQKRKNIRYREGDVFRFKIGRRQYGYGRILLDYDKMRKNKEPFWDILIGKPVVCSVYHIITDRKDISVDELKNCNTLPSQIVQDNSLFYGEYEIIGNLPITEHEDYPIMYGNSISFGEKAVCYQCGKMFRKIADGTEMYSGFRNNGVSFNLNFTLEILQRCIAEKTNEPYWNSYYPSYIDRDLRNPKYTDILKKIKLQFGLSYLKK